MRFQKGHIPWNKGIPHSKETREKLSQIQTGKDRGGIITKNCEFCGEEHKVPRHYIARGYGRCCSIQCANRLRCLGKTSWNKGKKMSEETKAKLSKSHIGKPSPHKGKKFPNRTGNNHHNWKGGKTTQNGYILCLVPHHPFSVGKGYVREHRLVAEKALKRFLRPTEHIHHINNQKDDNRIENLYLFESNSAHSLYHQKLMRGECERITASNLT